MKRSGWMVFVVAMLLGVTAFGAQGVDRVNEKLDTAVSLQFENTNVYVVCQFLEEKYGISILIDNHVVAPLGQKVSKSYVTDGLIQYVNVKDVAVREALNAILTPLGLAYAVKEQYVWVTTLERIDTKPYSDMEVKIFLLEDKVPSFDQANPGEPDLVLLLRKVIPKILDPETGELLSYMRYNLQTKQLVVRNASDNLDTVQLMVDLVSQPKQQ